MTMAAASASVRRAPRGAGRLSRPRRGGFTFLEVVAAAALLGLIAASIFAVFNFIMASQLRHQQTLGAMEVANRLVLQYLDDENSLPSRSAPIAYGPHRYRWEMQESPVRLEEAGREQRSAERTSPVDLDRFKQVTVRVWLSEESGGDRNPGQGQPEASLSRLVDPIAFRNYDSFENMINSPEGYQRFMEQLMGFGGAGGGGGGQEERGPGGGR